MFDLIINNYKNWLMNHPELQERTKLLYLKSLQKFLQYLEADSIHSLEEISEPLLTQFIHKRRKKIYAAPSIRGKLASLKIFFKWANEYNYCSINPFILYKQKKLIASLAPSGKPINNLPVFLSEKELSIYLNYLNSVTLNDFISVRNHSMLTLLLTSGLSAEEIIKLECDNISLDASTLNISYKHQGSRIVHLDTRIFKKTYLEWMTWRQQDSLLNEVPWLYVTSTYRPISLRALYNIVANSLAEACLHKPSSGPHVLRNTAIAIRLKKGENIETVSQELGIATLAHIEKYH